MWLVNSKIREYQLFFDKYACKKTSLKQFVEKYKVFLQDREEVEKHAGFNTWQKQPVLKTPSPFEKQMSMIYTQEVFKKNHVEVVELTRCHLMRKTEDTLLTTLIIFDFFF